MRPRATRYRTLNLVELSCDRMLHNIALFQAQNPQKAIIPVLKSNAYGHGITEVASILNDASIPMLAVDGYFEATRLRKASKHRILILGYIDPRNVRLLDTKRCSFVLQDVASLHAFGKLGRRVRVHIEVDTGMNRMGLKSAEMAEYLQVLKSYPKLELEGVMTHLADADNDSDDGFTAQQVARFDATVKEILAAGHKPKYIHVAQTAGSTKAHSKYANAIRLGIGLYGINPLLPTDRHYADLQDLRPVMRLKSTIVKVQQLEKGDRVSYNGIFTAPHSMRIGILPLGYYEGVPRELSNRGIVSSGANTLPIVGRVCMNHTMIDLTGTELQVGDQVTVISNDPTTPNSIAGITRDFQLFSYTLATNLSESIRRVIV